MPDNDNSGLSTIKDAADISGMMLDPALPTGAMVAMPHGGALRKGNPGNKGGPGRPPKQVMSRSRAIYERVLDALDDRLDDANALELADLVATGNMAGRYAGLGDDDTETRANVRVIVVRDGRTQPDDSQRVTASATIAEEPYVAPLPGHAWSEVATRERLSGERPRGSGTGLPIIP